MALVTHIPLTCSEARGLICPSTGKEHVIVMHICEDIVTYSVPDAFCLNDPQASIDTLYERATMRRGVRGVIPIEKALVDPYDESTKLTLVVTKDCEYYFDGGFDPRVATMNLPELIRKLSGGTRIIGDAPAAQSVEHPGDFKETDDPELVPHLAMDEFSEKIAEQMAQAMPGVSHGRETVSMAITGDAQGRENLDPEPSGTTESITPGKKSGRKPTQKSTRGTRRTTPSA